MISWAVTDKGIVRKQNQDTYFAYCDEGRGFALLAVCDGMGGAKAGNIASLMAAEAFSSEFKKNFDADPDENKIEDYISDAVTTANARIYASSLENSDYTGMGTTIVSAVVSGNRTVVANVGDSRAYHISPIYGIKQITRDHSVVEDLVRRGDITRAESYHHPNKNLITRALGTLPEIRADYFYPHVENGDYLLLCSDGLSNLVGEQELLYEILRSESLEEAGERLLNLGFSRGAPDNITIVLFKK